MYKNRNAPRLLFVCLKYSAKMENLLVVLVVAAFLGLAAGQCPTIVTRAQWGARAANTAALTTFPPTHVIIHHTAGSACSTQAACAQQMRNIQNWHMDGNGWADIGYNFLVGGDGLVYEGRGWGRTGAHTVSFNARSIGIGYIGTFTTSLPTVAAQNAGRNLITCGVNQGQIAWSHRLGGHRQASATECPGQSFFNLIQSWPNFANPL